LEYLHCDEILKKQSGAVEQSINIQKVSRSFWVGMVHGLAGTGGACAVALTLAARDAYTAVWIIVLQSLGIILSMSARMAISLLFQ
jgi:nickel/cobalt exporter